MKYAHYFKTSKHHQLVVSESTKPVGEVINFASKKEMQGYVKDNNLKAWNF